MREEHKESASQAFADTGVNVTSEGKRHLGAAIGSHSFTVQYVSRKVQEWSEEVQRLAHVAISQPHAAYAAFTHGLAGRWTYLLRIIPDVQDLLLPLENVIQQHFIPALTGLPPCSKLERDLLALPVRHGGLGIANPTTLSSPYYQASRLLTKPLVSLIESQEANETVDPETILATKREVRNLNRTRHMQQASHVKDQLPESLKRHADLASEKGASFMAVSPAYRRVWLPSTQRGIQRCATPQIQLATKQHPSDMHLWCPVHRRSCDDLSHGGLPDNSS